MPSAVSVVQLLATVTTFVLFSSGLPMIRKIAADKDAGAVSPIPWLTQVVNGLMWLKYGLLVGDKMIIGVNLTGAISGLYYIKVYGDHTSGAGFGRAVARAAAAAYTPLLIIQLMPSYESAVLFMGYVSSLLSVLLFGSPLVNALKVIRTKSAASMNVLQSVMSCACAGSWALYGLLIHDNFVLMPNILGTVLGVMQVLLLLIYPR